MLFNFSSCTVKHQASHPYKNKYKIKSFAHFNFCIYKKQKDHDSELNGSKHQNLICSLSFSECNFDLIQELSNSWVLPPLWIIYYLPLYCNIFGVSPDTRRQLSLNNENKAFPRRVTMEADVTMDRYRYKNVNESITMNTAVWSTVQCWRRKRSDVWSTV
jgi:hypothetical protein